MLPGQALAQPNAAGQAPLQPIAGGDDLWADLNVPVIFEPTWMWSTTWRCWLIAPHDWEERADGAWARCYAWRNETVWVWFRIP